MSDAGNRLTIEPARDVLLMSRELQGRVLLDLESDVGPDVVESTPDDSDASPMVMVSRSTSTATEGATVVGQLQRVVCLPDLLVVELRMGCDQALDLLADALHPSEKVSYGDTRVCRADDTTGRTFLLAVGPPKQAEISMITPAGICTLTLTFARPRAA